MSDSRISDLFFRLRHEERKRRHDDKFAIKALVLCPDTAIEFARELSALQRIADAGGALPPFSDGWYAGLRWYVDPTLTGEMNIEYVETDALNVSLAREVSAAVGIPCRAIV